MKLIKKFFIKDYKKTNDKVVRFRYGLTAGIFGVVSNLILFVGKLLIGIIGCSITIIADAINNLSDIGSSTIVLLGFKLSAKPADSEHPFGHERYEQIMALIVSVIVMAIGVLLAKSSVEKIISPEPTTVSVVTYIVLGLAILIKLFQMALYSDFSKSIKSEILKASSVDSRNDVISTSAVLVAMIIINIVGDIGVSIDGIFGLIVSIFIIYSSIKLLKETIGPLLGEMPDEKFVKKLKDKILSYDGVLGLHDFMIHSYGANNFFVNAHVEVSSKVNIMVSHDMIDNIERDFKEQFNIVLSIHMDPIEDDNEEVVFNRKKVETIVKNIDKSLSIHDFRMVFGETHINVLFDVVVPFSCKLTLEEIREKVEEVYQDEKIKHFFIIGFDRI